MRINSSLCKSNRYKKVGRKKKMKVKVINFPLLEQTALGVQQFWLERVNNGIRWN